MANAVGKKYAASKRNAAARYATVCHLTLVFLRTLPLRGMHVAPTSGNEHKHFHAQRVEIILLYWPISFITFQIKCYSFLLCPFYIILSFLLSFLCHHYQQRRSGGPAPNTKN